MELDFVTNNILEEEAVEVEENNNDVSNIEGERCGICMDIIIDRGVLDCCQHWFCFACIDNWATITNLCPLCQSEFQMITCVPVYDITGSHKVDEDLFSRDDEWCVDGKSNTLSFPSYYIDENAVICLDGDGCKIRSGFIDIDEDSNLDTSIACDSCDMWYHAFCVGFDTEGSAEDTWLCPRCIANEMPHKSDVISIERTSNLCGPEIAKSECLPSPEVTFSGKVSISFADAGENDVVISMVGANQWTEEPSENFLSAHQVDKNPDPDGNMEKPSSERNNPQSMLEGEELELSLSHDMSSSLLLRSLVTCKSKTNSADEATNELSDLDGFRNSSRFDESRMGLHLGLSVGSFLSVDEVNNDGNMGRVLGDVQQQNPTKESPSKVNDVINDETMDQVAVDVQQQDPAKESLSKVDKIVSDAHTDAARNIGIKRKHTDCGDVDSSADHDKTEAKNEKEASAKKSRAGERIEVVSKHQDASVPNDSPKFPTVKCSLVKEDTSSDIMSIVKGAGRRPSKGLVCQNSADKSSTGGENAAGLRVKKIMRRAGEDKESSIVVQKLRKEIREAVRTKSTKEIGENLFDPKLLAAFRAAVAGPKTEPPNKLSPMAVKTKKSMLQKGKVRENLTKKIYGDSNGKRRRAWDRDCEVEFWKHRCMRATKPEKIETLKSVLGLLRKNSEGSEVKPASDLEAQNPILSRLYLADTSVFPRKDDIKPLSVVKETGSSQQNKEQVISLEKTSQSSLDSPDLRTTETNKVQSKIAEVKGTSTNISRSKGVTASGKINLNKRLEGSSLSSMSDSKSNSQKEMVAKSDDDKRKWAREVLARKKALAGNSTTQEKQEDNAVLKGNYPLLVQLPVDMRPVLAPSLHNKVPMSVRQTQLYRLTEHFLRKANLPVIRRTAATELAVADAVNIEREVADRSNSKLVYLNLCSQEILHRSDNNSSIRTTESNSSSSSVVSTDMLEQTTDELSTDPTIIEALRNAGLLSDSPPNSPNHEMKVPKELDESSVQTREEEPDNVFEMDSHPEVDIYGDFEYDLEDEDYIGARAMKALKLQPEEDVSKVKVVFSTLNSERSSHGHGMSGNAEVTGDFTSLLKSHTDADIRSSTVEGGTDKSCVPLESVPDEGEELSVAECEELYGPDKEPLINKFPEGASRKLCGLVDGAAPAQHRVPESSDNAASNQLVTEPENGSESNVLSKIVATDCQNPSSEENMSNQIQASKSNQRKEKKLNADTDKQNEGINSVSKKVEAYIKEHIRPLCKSGVITAEQYRWAVTKTTEKVMKYHSNAKNASFLIKEGEKVKKLAEQYVETAQHKEKSDLL